MSGILNELKEKNPSVACYAVTDPEFAAYGRVVPADCGHLLAAAELLRIPAEGTAYTASVPELERCPEKERFEQTVFGELPVQIGFCCGHNDRLNALEWHKTSEVNLAVTDLVLLLAGLRDLTDLRADSSVCKAFYVPKGTCYELYANTLHFCPCQASDSGFASVCILPCGTNLPLMQTPDDRYLYRKNKWLIAHEENTALREKGVPAGITGRNIEIRYPEKRS